MRAGARFEQWVADYLSEETGLKVERRSRHGNKDRGDLSHVVTSTGLDVAVECKDYNGKYGGLLPGWIAEAETERGNSGADLGVVVFKREDYGEARMWGQFVAMDLRTFARLVGKTEK